MSAQLRDVEIVWIEPSARTSRPRSLGQVHREGFEISGSEARRLVTISPGEIEGTDRVTATLDAIEPVLERIIRQVWRHRRPTERRSRPRRRT